MWVAKNRLVHGTYEDVCDMQQQVRNPITSLRRLSAMQLLELHLEWLHPYHLRYMRGTLPILASIPRASGQVRVKLSSLATQCS